VAPNNYCTLGDIKDALPDTDWGTNYDALLTYLAGAASRALDRTTKRPPGFWNVTTDTVRQYIGSGVAQQWVDPLAAAPTLVEMDVTGGGDWVAVNSTDYYLWPYNAVDLGQPYRRLDFSPLHSQTYYLWYRWQGQPSIRITGKWGWATKTPDEVKQAATIQAVKWFKRAQQAFADTGAIIELGQLRYTKALDPDVAEMCKSLTRITV
jgi:hypothetical protein